MGASGIPSNGEQPSADAKEVLVVLRDLQSREFLTKLKLVEDAASITVIEQSESLPVGNYVVTACSNNVLYNYKFAVK